jgi:hypothetical protein
MLSQQKKHNLVEAAFEGTFLNEKDVRLELIIFINRFQRRKTRTARILNFLWALLYCVATVQSSKGPVSTIKATVRVHILHKNLGYL